MTISLKPYPSMRDAGVPWLGWVPEHWKTQRMRNLVDMRVSNIDKHTKEGELPVRLCNYVDVYKNEVINDRVSFMRATATVDEIERFRLELGDVLITKDSEAWNDIGVPAIIEYTAPDLVCGYHLALLRPREGLLIDKYLLRALQCRAVSYQFHVAANGVTRYGLSHDAIKSVVLPLPPISEQAAIVRFLDHADLRIRSYIRTNQKLIKVLEEQTQAIIHQAVTHGLDPSIRLKLSGVAWLGEVPEHWTLKRFKFVARIASGQVDPRLPEQRGKILIAPNHMKSGTGTITRYETAEEQGADSGKYVVRRGQVVYSKIRPNLRKAAIVGMDCLCSADMYPIAVREDQVKPAFLLLLMLSKPFTRYVVDCSLRVAMPKVNREALGDGWLWYPAVEEQAAILQFVDRSVGPITQTIARTENRIALVREYRARLIADLVTGKRDVREVALTLPDETDKLELLENEADIEDHDAELDDANRQAELDQVEA